MKTKRVLLFVSLLPLSACSLIPGDGASQSNASAPFLINLKNSKTSLALSDAIDFAKTADSLAVSSKDMKPLREFTYSALPAPNLLDTEATSFDYGAYSDGGEAKAFNYFKYTFYLKNTEDLISKYDLTINLEEKKSNAVAISDTLRVMVFENNVSDLNNQSNHDYKVFAKASETTNYSIDSNPTNREFVSNVPPSNTEDDEHPLADTFISDSIVCRFFKDNMKVNDTIRYTVVYWLEGNDPQSDPEQTAPEGLSFKIKIDINAVESN